jgi:uncharacterized protein YjbI with pentapeptide repeats
MNLSFRYILQLDCDKNMFQRKHFEDLHNVLRKDEHGNHLETVDFEKATLKNLDLNGLDLSNFNFSKAHLKNINFHGSSLHGVSFEQAQLVDCNFSETRFTQCNLGKMNASGCNFTGAELSGYMRWMIVDNCSFKNVHFSGGILTGTDFSSCIVEGNRYENIELSGLIFPDEE